MELRFKMENSWWMVTLRISWNDCTLLVEGATCQNIIINNRRKLSQISDYTNSEPCLMATIKKNLAGNRSISYSQDGIVPRFVNGVQSHPRFFAMKRPMSAPVSMQGWLQKQGSDGLMLWKKRWFVLSEYCLYYYKNSNEEKVLGSILLPSYKISPCSTVEGKLFRKKFSFKAEHANMRTYYFASDTKERMVEWMNAMSLATIAQEKPLEFGLVDSRKDDFECTEKLLNINFHTTDNVNSKINGPVSIKNLESGSGHGNSQPLYVNAPPKPRRTTESWEQSYDRNNNSAQNDKNQEFIVSNGRHFPYQSAMEVSTSDLETRYTPEGYGTPPPSLSFHVDSASESLPLPKMYTSDYEELYGLALIPAACQRTTKNVISVVDQALWHNASSPSRNLKLANRPRSVDFLQSCEKNVQQFRNANESSLRQKAVEFSDDCRIGCDGSTVQLLGVFLPRPKSSTDVVSDGFHWSEEQYAESMRKSAQYLILKTNRSHFRNTAAKKKSFSNSCSGGSISSSSNSSNSGSNANSNSSNSRSNKDTAEATVKSCDARLVKSHFSMDDATTGTDSIYSSFSSAKCYNGRITKSSQNDFTRSKSARLGREKAFNTDVGDLVCKRTDRAYLKELNDRRNQQFQQKEESMKRLLEWKQRMLQSPLSRKSLISSSNGNDSKRGTWKYETSKYIDDNIRRSQSTHLLASKENDFSNRIRQFIRVSNSDREIELEESKKLYCLPSNTGQNQAELDNCLTIVKGVDPVKNIIRPPSEEKLDGMENENENGKCPINYVVSISEEKQGPTSLQKPIFFESEINASIPIETSYHRKLSNGGPTTTEACSKLSFASNDATSSNIKYGFSNWSQGSQDDDTVETNVDEEKQELPPQNIVQDRIKVFEKPADSRWDGKSPSRMRSRSPPILSGRMEISQLSVHNSDNSSRHRMDANEGRKYFANVGHAEKLSKIKEENVILVASASDAIERMPHLKSSARDGFLLNVDCEETNRVDDIASREAEFNEKKDFSCVNPNERYAGTTTLSSTCSLVVNRELRTAAEEGEGRDVHDDEVEDHYLPMAPCKKQPIFNMTGDLFYHTRSNSASSASQIMILETLLSEDVENSYVEMTVGGEDKSYTAASLPKANTNANANKGDHVTEEKFDSEKSHYELLYKASSSMEPLYMEVVLSKENSSSRDENIFEFGENESATAGLVLPDILNSPSTLRQLTDSSDADDEASKEFDPLDIPRHPRFSLSDTFRPASYYLGTGISDRHTLGLSFDQPDSSDSDLVSPPPIPTSPPPLDDFNQSLDVCDMKNEINVEHVHSENDPVDNDFLPPTSYKSQFECDEGKEHLEFSNCNDGEKGDKRQPLEHREVNYPKWNAAVTHGHLLDNVDGDDVIKTFSYPNADILSERKVEDVSMCADVTSEQFSIPSLTADCPPGAPYYYADLLKSDECDKWTYESNKKRETNDEKLILNNKRVNNGVEMANSNKRNDVGKKVNQIATENEVSDRCEKNATATTTKTAKTTTSILSSSVPSYKYLADDKNIYNADVFQNKLCKIGRCCGSPQSVNDVLNLFAQNAACDSDGAVCQDGLKTRSVGQLNEISTNTLTDQQILSCDDERIASSTKPDVACLTSGNEALWQEDNLWRETLRKSSLRHARSLDDLDKQNTPSFSSVKMKSGRQSADILSSDTRKSSFGKLSRDVTYVNDCVSAQMRKAKQNSKEYTEDYREIRKIKRYPRMPIDDNVNGDGHDSGSGDAYYERLDPRATLTQNGIGVGIGFYHHQRNYNHQQPQQQQHQRASRQNSFAIDSMKQHGKNNTQPKTGAQSFLEEGVYPTKPPSFEIDREKLRQWDLMSSAPVAMLNAIQKYPVAEMQAYQMERNAICVALTAECTPPNSPALDSGFVTGRSLPSPQNRILQVQDQISPINMKHEYTAKVGSIDEQHQFHNQQGEMSTLPVCKQTEDTTWNLNVSAGELLGRTHEELILLLIQLRRQSASLCKAMENCHYEIESQARLFETHNLKKFARTDRVEYLKKRLTELEKQVDIFNLDYEKGKPLVNLVDNMVKLGSLYRNTSPNQCGQFQKEHSLRSKLEFNDRIQELRFVNDERKEWERVYSDHNGLQVKVDELYKLDRELQRESSQLQNLKQDKDLLEYALKGLKCKMQDIRGNPTEMERCKRQQLILEQELTRVRSVLASNSKKLEETIAANAKLEAELIILRQKLQLNERLSQENVVTIPTIGALESELRRVQMLVGNLQRQRAELNSQVRQLTEKSKNLCRQTDPVSMDFADADSTATKKRNANGWIETDLDTGVMQNANEEHFFNSTSSFDSNSFVSFYCNPQKTSTALDKYDVTAAHQAEDTTTTLYATQFAELFCSPLCKERAYCEQIDIGESDDKTKRFYGITPREKSQEIRTVRIVKRESERRQRDRDRNNVGIPITLNSKRNSFPSENFISANTYPVSEATAADEKQLYEAASSVDFERRRGENILYSLTLSSATPTLTSTTTSELTICGCISNENEKKDDNVYRGHSSENNCAGLGQDERRMEGRQRANNTKLFFEKLDINQNETAAQSSSIYRSKAAKEIVEELISKVNIDRKICGSHRRTPKEKRRHHTISNNKPIWPLDSTKENARARDDIDMERALRPRLNGTPDVIRSALYRTSDTGNYNAETIDNVIRRPEKILIPERYVPENVPQLSPEERHKRLKKAEAIRKMLTETSAFSAVTENGE